MEGLSPSYHSDLYGLLRVAFPNHAIWSSPSSHLVPGTLVIRISCLSFLYSTYPHVENTFFIVFFLPLARML